MSQFFTEEPLPCDPSELPVYPPSKEFDARYREEEARKYVKFTSSTQNDHNNPCSAFHHLLENTLANVIFNVYRRKAEAMKGHVPESVRMGAGELKAQPKGQVDPFNPFITTL